MTDEGVSDTEKWVASKGAKYAYAYDKGGALSRYFGVSGIPHAVLIDASGTVVWDGHPGSVDTALIETATKGALTKPLWEWTGAAKPVKAALLKRAYKEALDAAAKLGEADNGPQIKAAIEGIVKSRIDGMQSDYTAGNYLGAQTAASELSTQLKGLPEMDAALKLAADIAANKDAQPILKAQRQVAKIRAGDLAKRKEIEAAIEDLKKIMRAAPGSYAAKEAEALVTDLNKKKDANK
mgnify:FL=1